jgi:hypothetical protein
MTRKLQESEAFLGDTLMGYRLEGEKVPEESMEGLPRKRGRGTTDGASMCLDGICHLLA